VKCQPAAYLSFALILLILAEVLAQVVLVIGEPWLGKVRRVTDIYKEQTEYIHKLIDEEGGLRREILDRELGWRYRPGFQEGADMINSQGLRSEREYSYKAGKGVLRIAAFGDSFVYSNEVATPDAWSSQIEQACKGIEVLNYGVGGYGVDQAFLRYEAEGDAFAPDIVLMGFVADDMGRLVNRYRRFLSDRELPLFKPRYRLQGAGISLMPNPFPAISDYEEIARSPAMIIRIGPDDYWYQPAIYENPFYDFSWTVRLAVTLQIRVQRKYLDPAPIWNEDFLNNESEAFKIQIALFEKFMETAKSRNARPYVVFFPWKEDVHGIRSGKGTSYGLLTRELDRMNIQYIDLINGFVQYPLEPIASFFMPGEHYSRMGNQVAADQLVSLFRSEATAGCQ
jgi:hypothetical protein